MGLRLTPVVHSYLCHTSHYIKNLFLYAAYGLINSRELNLNLSYQCHRLQILQQEGHVGRNHKF